jgi:integrase
MKTASNDTSQAASLENQSSNTGFEHRGRAYAVFKRGEKYYIHFQYKGRRYLKTLDTNLVGVAKTRAKVFIESVMNGLWNPVKPEIPESKIYTFGEIAEVYMETATVMPKTAKENVQALYLVLKALGQENPAAVKLNYLSGKKVAVYQAAMVSRYRDRAETEEDRRDAKVRALRSSRSQLRQGRSLFCERQRSIYEDRGIDIPECLLEFCRARMEGRNDKREYLAPEDGVIEKIFVEVETLFDRDRTSFIAFWFAVGAGLRRGEIGRMRWEWIIDRDGQPWVSGGVGKKGEKVEVPIQDRAWAALSRVRQESGLVLGTASKNLVWARNINYWLRLNGMVNTEKVLHELRAYVGSLIYMQNPVAAMKFMRHGNLATTERFYCRYGKNIVKPVNVL